MTYSGSPIADAAQHMNYLDSLPDEIDHPEHECVCCGDKFYAKQGEGVMIGGEEKFCYTCVSGFRHYEFYHKCGLSPRKIYHLTENYTKNI